MIYFLYGDEGFLVEEKVRELLAQHADKDCISYQDQFSLSDLFQSIVTPSLFSSAKIFVLKNPFILYETVSDEDYRLFLEICKNVSDTDYLLLIYSLDKSVDMRKKVNSFLKKNATALEFLAFKDYEQAKIMAWVKQRVQKIGKTIEESALVALENNHGSNLRQLSQEIEKLDIYTGNRKQIVLADVSLMTTGSHVSIFDFTDALKERNLTKIVSVALSLLADGDDPIKLLGFMASNFRLFYQLSYLSSSALSVGQMAKETGKNPYYLEKMLPFVKKHYSVSDFPILFKLLNQTDIAIKSGRLNPRQAILNLIYSLQF